MYISNFFSRVTQTDQDVAGGVLDVRGILTIVKEDTVSSRRLKATPSSAHLCLAILILVHMFMFL